MNGTDKTLFCCDIRIRAAEDQTDDDDDDDDDGGTCPRPKLASVRQSWKGLMEKLTDTEKVSVFEAVIDNIADLDETAAEDLKAEYLKAASDSMPQAASRFFEDWHVILITYPDVGRLTACLQDLAGMRSRWAQTFLGNAPLVAGSIIQ